jgi:hypothetical protein
VGHDSIGRRSDYTAPDRGERRPGRTLRMSPVALLSVRRTRLVGPNAALASTGTCSLSTVNLTTSALLVEEQVECFRNASLCVAPSAGPNSQDVALELLSGYMANMGTLSDLRDKLSDVGRMVATTLDSLCRAAFHTLLGGMKPALPILSDDSVRKQTDAHSSSKEDSAWEPESFQPAPNGDWRRRRIQESEQLALCAVAEAG